MKYRDSKTGEVFEDIAKVAEDFCYLKDCEFNYCPIDGKTGGQSCSDWISNHPAEAARLMGLEVVEQEESTMGQANRMEQSTKPRICQVLGVEVGEQITYSDPEKGEIDFRILEDGNVAFTFKGGKNLGNTGMGYTIVQAINHPDRIIRKPRFTEDEVADAKALIRILGATGIERTEYGGNLCAVIEENAKVVIDQGLFPSLRPGQAVALADVVAQHL